MLSWLLQSLWLLLAYSDKRVIPKSSGPTHLGLFRVYPKEPQGGGTARFWNHPFIIIGYCCHCCLCPYPYYVYVYNVWQSEGANMWYLFISISMIINRPGVAGAVLQTPL